MGSAADCSFLSDGQKLTIGTGGTPGRFATTGIPKEDPCGQEPHQVPPPSTPGFAGNCFQAFGDEEEMQGPQEYRLQSESLRNMGLKADDIAAPPRSQGTMPLESNTSCNLDFEALCAENRLLRQEVERQRLQIQELAAGRAEADASIPMVGGVPDSVCNAQTGPETSGSEPDADAAICSVDGDSAQEPSTLASIGETAAAATAATAAAAAVVKHLQAQVSVHETTVTSSAATPVSIKVRSPVAQTEVRPTLELASPNPAPVGSGASKVGRPEWWQQTPEASPVPTSVEPLTQVPTQVPNQVLTEGRRVEVWSQDKWLPGTVVAVPSCDKEGRGRWAVQCDADRRGELTLARHVRVLFEPEKAPAAPAVPQRFIITGVRDFATPKGTPRPHHSGTTAASTAGAPSPVPSGTHQLAAPSPIPSGTHQLAAPSPVPSGTHQLAAPSPPGPSGTHSVPVPARPMALTKPVAPLPQHAQLQKPQATGVSVQSSAAYASRPVAPAGSSAAQRVCSVEPSPRRQRSVGTPLTAAALGGLAAQMAAAPMTPNRCQATGAESQRSTYVQSALSPRPGYNAVAALGIRNGATPVQQQQPVAGTSANLRIPLQQQQC